MSFMTEIHINRLQPKHMNLIRSIAELGQLSLAAQELALTQPAASRMLGEIERYVGSPIFIEPRRAWSRRRWGAHWPDGR